MLLTTAVAYNSTFWVTDLNSSRFAQTAHSGQLRWVLGLFGPGEFRVYANLDSSGELVLLFFHAKSTLHIKLGSLGCQLRPVTVQLCKIRTLLLQQLVLKTFPQS